MDKCKVLVYDSKSKESQWIDGEITRLKSADDYDGLRYDAKTKDTLYPGCHRDCVKFA